ncbi:hypothetical protein V7024_17080 [Bacillus sp. JJ864]|uniref:hypothetical protein n=1 Tax=Bacillus sp. JJ864 TaxID=3122975 RepID=UPI002FFFFD41
MILINRLFINQFIKFWSSWKMNLFCFLLLSGFIEYSFFHQIKLHETIDFFNIIEIIQDRYMYLYIFIPIVLLQLGIFQSTGLNEIVAYRRKSYEFVIGLINTFLVLLTFLLFFIVVMSLTNIFYIYNDRYIDDVYVFFISQLYMSILLGLVCICLIWLIVKVLTNNRFIAFIVTLFISFIENYLSSKFKLSLFWGKSFEVSIDQSILAHYFGIFSLIGVVLILVSVFYLFSMKKEYLS